MLRRHESEQLPITSTIVDRVHGMTSSGNQAGDLVFHDRTGPLVEKIDPEVFVFLTSSPPPAILK